MKLVGSENVKVKANQRRSINLLLKRGISSQINFCFFLFFFLYLKEKLILFRAKVGFFKCVHMI